MTSFASCLLKRGGITLATETFVNALDRPPQKTGMNIDLSNHVIARLNDAGSNLPRRTLDLGNINTPELGLLSPQRSEIAPRGLGRDAALVAYSERLRQSYKSNEGGIRDGMLKLGEAFRAGQPITVSCFCRAGEMCHADVVKLAIEKVGKSLAKDVVREGPQQVPQHTSADRLSNPRTQRAVNEILSVGRSDVLLSKLDDTQGRNRSEHASHLNGQSQFIRDLYERGAVVRDGVLIAPQETPKTSRPLAIASLEYAVRKLEPLVNQSRAKELAPQIIEYGTKIAGSSADRETTIKVFNWLYDALEGRGDLFEGDQRVPEAETKEERFDRTLGDLARLAEEMNRLEPSDRSVQIEQLIEPEAVEKELGDGDLSLEPIYDEAISQEERANATETEHALGDVQEFWRVELEDMSLARLAGEMSQDDLEKWVSVRLPVIDEMLESGTPVGSILKPFENGIYNAVRHDPASKLEAINDLKFASAYIQRQLKQPESRLRHFNPRYREYAAMLEKAVSREEVIDAASRVRLENAQLGFRWESLPEREKVNTSRPLTSREMRYLFTEASPRHYSSEMTVARLAYLNAGEAARTRTEALMRGEIAPSKEAAQLVESLELRKEREQFKDSLSATKHFLQSLKTPNDELRYKNSFDHAGVYRKLPPAERDFVYRRASEQKELLESKLLSDEKNVAPRDQDSLSSRKPIVEAHSFREALKGDLTELLTSNPGITGQDLSDRTSLIIERNLAVLRSRTAPENGLVSLSREIVEGVSANLRVELSSSIRTRHPDHEAASRGASAHRIPASRGHEK